MRVSVVVPTFRRADLLARCLAAICRQTLAPREFEVLVCDDAADEATRRQIESLSSPVAIRCLPVTGRHGPAAARNIGWQAARGEVVAFTDDDCIPDSNWLAAGLLPFSDPAVIAVTGQTVVPLPPSPTDFERNTAGLARSEFITANCFCRRTALVAIGGFDEDFPLAWREDSDLHFRLLDTGGQVVRQSDAVVIHPARPAKWGWCLREQRKAQFDALLYRKHPRHFRERITPRCPWRYYAIALSALAAIAAAAMGNYWLLIAACGIWLFLTAELTLRRLRGASHSLSHVSEMAITSALIPFLSIAWRLRGAARYRVLFW